MSILDPKQLTAAAEVSVDSAVETVIGRLIPALEAMLQRERKAWIEELAGLGLTVGVTRGVPPWQPRFRNDDTSDK